MSYDINILGIKTSGKHGIYEIEKSNAHVMMNLAVTLRELNRLDESEQHFISSLEIEKNPDCLNNYAILNIKKKKYNDAIKLLDMAIKKIIVLFTN